MKALIKAQTLITSCYYAIDKLIEGMKLIIWVYNIRKKLAKNRLE